MIVTHVPLEVLPHGQGLGLPRYATSGASGMDLRAACQEPVHIPTRAIATIPTGLRMAIPEGYEAQIRSRSGLVRQHRILVPNAPGTVDSDYRGEIQVMLLNLGDEAFTVTRGDRIAQLVLAPVACCQWAQLFDTPLPDTKRGSGGFGSTGR